ncbi:MAG: hypothetical protein DLD55_01125 [candidate division SR1 bacterium]|nr:MAG: hypothetical protein DLD55_01125 [candidate division SR1 bacterium]
MALENEIKAGGEVAKALSTSERGTFLAVMGGSFIVIIFLVVYFLSSINHIVEDHNKALKEQRQEFLQTLKDMK